MLFINVHATNASSRSFRTSDGRQINARQSLFVQFPGLVRLWPIVLPAERLNIVPHSFIFMANNKHLLIGLMLGIVLSYSADRQEALQNACASRSGIKEGGRWWREVMQTAEAMRLTRLIASSRPGPPRCVAGERIWSRLAFSRLALPHRS